MKHVEGYEMCLFEVEDTMPCAPTDVRIQRYGFSYSPLVRVEREEAAARILSYCQLLNRWVGVSWEQLMDQMQDDIEVFNRMVQARNSEIAALKKARRKFAILCLLTLGVHALFVKAPVDPFEQGEGASKIAVPYTMIYGVGPQAVINGIRELVERDMLKHEKVSGKLMGGFRTGLEAVIIPEGETDVFLPTPRLIEHILKVQNAQTAS